MLVVLADHLGEDVERAGGDHHVVDLVHRGDRVDDRVEVALGLDADHRLPGEPDLQRVGDRDDLHDPGADQPLHPLPDGGFGQPDRSGDRRIRPPAVLLELLDDGLGQVVEWCGGPSPDGRRDVVVGCAEWLSGHEPMMTTTRGRNAQVIPSTKPNGNTDLA